MKTRRSKWRRVRAFWRYDVTREAAIGTGLITFIFVVALVVL